MTDPLSTDCPARQMARQFIAKFDRDNGIVHLADKVVKARISFSRPKRSRRVKVDSFLATPPPYRCGIIGRCGNHHVRDSAEHCEIGDMVEFYAGDIPEGTHFVRMPSMRFEKVSAQLTSDNGRTFQTYQFWKRVS